MWITVRSLAGHKEPAREGRHVAGSLDEVLHDKGIVYGAGIGSRATDHGWHVRDWGSGPFGPTLHWRAKTSLSPRSMRCAGPDALGGRFASTIHICTACRIGGGTGRQ